MKKLLNVIVCVLLVSTGYILGASCTEVHADMVATSKLKVRVVGAQGMPLLNESTIIEHMDPANHATTQMEKSDYSDPYSPIETLSISDVPYGTTEIVIHVNKMIHIP